LRKFGGCPATHAPTQAPPGATNFIPTVAGQIVCICSEGDGVCPPGYGSGTCATGQCAAAEIARCASFNNSDSACCGCGDCFTMCQGYNRTEDRCDTCAAGTSDVDARPSTACTSCANGTYSPAGAHGNTCTVQLGTTALVACNDTGCTECL
jgi:hypothetical protein